MQHSFNVELATELKIEKACILHNIVFWRIKDKENNHNFYDGKRWVYNSASAFGKLFPYMNSRSIARRLNELVEEGYLYSGCYNKIKFDKTIWYSPTQKTLTYYGTCVSQNDQSIGQNDSSIGQPDQTIPISNPISNPINKTLADNENESSPLEEGNNNKNPPHSARPPTQALSTFSMCKTLIDLCPSCDKEPDFILKRIEKWLEKDTWDNILTGYTNYCKKHGRSSQRPTTIITNGEYKDYILEKEKSPRLAKLEEMLASPKRRTHPTEQSSYGGMRQYQGLLPQEEEEYNKLSMEFYGEVMIKNTFRLYPE